jgi:cobalt-zinc-cadmium efflux system protein
MQSFFHPHDDNGRTHNHEHPHGMAAHLGGSHHGHHHHSHAPVTFDHAFGIGVALNVAFVLIEGGCGFWINSMALLADAGHNLSDVVSLLLAWFAIRLARREAHGRYTYGYGRATILSALANAVLLVVACGGIVWEAIQRLREPADVQGGVIMTVAFVGIIINGATALLFMRGNQHDTNIRGAFLHMAADAAVSLGVMLAGFLITFTHWLWLDPLISLVIVAVILWGTWGLLTDALNLALDAVPRSIDLERVREYLLSLEEVQSIHDLHIWAMSSTETALTAHVLVSEMPADRSNSLLESIMDELERRFDIVHTTIQFEIQPDDGSTFVCSQACDEHSKEQSKAPSEHGEQRMSEPPKKLLY